MNDAHMHRDPQPLDTRQEASPADLAAARLIVDTWVDLSGERRRDLRSALDCAAKMAGRPADTVALDCETLSEALLGRSPSYYGLSQKRRANIVAGVRYVLTRLGIASERLPGVESFSTDWRAIWEGTDTKLRRYRLCRFVAYCAKEGISPEQVNDGTVEAFVDWAASSTLTAKPVRHGRNIVTAWNQLIATDSHPAIQRLEWHRGCKRYTFELTEYPASFQQEVDEFARRISGAGPDVLFDAVEFDDSDGPGRPAHPMRPRTVALRVYQILLAGAALVHSGRPKEAITGLRDLVAPIDNPRMILKFFWQRGHQQPSSFIAGIAEVLRQIAKYHVMLPEREVNRIAAMRQRVEPIETHGIRPKNRERLRALIENPTRALLIHLPGELAKRAQKEQDPTMAARLAMCATALEILLICPLRISNLTGLRLDRNLRREIGGRNRITHIVLAPEEVKNAVAIEWPVPPDTAELLDVWLTRHRANHGESGNMWLFPGRGMSGTSIPRLRNLLCREIELSTGARVHPHLLRHFAAWLFLRHNPGAYELVRRILGHRSIKTTIDAYTGLEADVAAKRLDDVIFRERKATRAIAAAAKPGRRTGWLVRGGN